MQKNSCNPAFPPRKIWIQQWHRGTAILTKDLREVEASDGQKAGPKQVPAVQHSLTPALCQVLAGCRHSMLAAEQAGSSHVALASMHLQSLAFIQQFSSEHPLYFPVKIIKRIVYFYENPIVAGMFLPWYQYLWTGTRASTVHSTAS